ncbi:comF family protein [Aerococcus viridans]|uniref:Competence protein ComFC n=2 Tax=Aerococcus viridans TaxID=1377 RepID=A0AAU8U784_9LACT|nr:ComF family protein [Aerococcus viridans]AMC01745.1 competence protein ComFC [Aerococcus viridans]EFG49046.1 comF family protein [Aerococcus viridans ATCC 11563 = CCUG 4311]SUU12737.1 comF family protein [Aerococcus viridans]
MTNLFKTLMNDESTTTDTASACLICQNILDIHLTLSDILSLGRIQPALFCQECLSGLETIPIKNTCKQCGRPVVEGMVVEVNAEGFCSDCQSWHRYHNWHFKNQAFYQYNRIFKDWLVVLKGQGDIRGRFLFAHEIRSAYRKDQNAIWVPMPSSSEKVANRGFNQTALLLEAARIPYKDLLISEGNKGKQAYKNRQNRLRDLNKIRINPAISPLDQRRPIVLFDDVYTTGTTMFSAYKALELAGFSQISGLTLAR